MLNDDWQELQANDPGYEQWAQQQDEQCVLEFDRWVSTTPEGKAWLAEMEDKGSVYATDGYPRDDVGYAWEGLE